MSGERGSSSGVSGDVLSWLPRLFSGERDSVSGERGSSSGVSGDVLSWLGFGFVGMCTVWMLVSPQSRESFAKESLYLCRSSLSPWRST